MRITRTVQWTLLADRTKALQALSPAVEKAKFTLQSSNPDKVIIDVPRAILRDRWAAEITGTISADGDTTRIDWRVEAMGDRHYEHLAKISKGLPAGLHYDHGIKDLMLQTPGFIFAAVEIGHLPNLIEHGETVLAMGVGKIADKKALAAVTNRRVMFLEMGVATYRDSLTTFDLEVIQAVDLAKSTSGESLTITYNGMTSVMTRIAHGSGDALALAIRTAKAASAPAPVLPAAAPPQQDLIGQLERLAALRTQGILTEEEFQTQKIGLLA
ncbi:PH domain-containing protein [Arthrobacter sp. TB 26]|uniref:PH domain-containing protein n=1 Tax=Arthrobacter sp. TB 26 TaxID=494420 RepID=UPI00042A63C8|nr:PH domain-containing protein [Arthrobacter sp. TB 26]